MKKREQEWRSEEARLEDERAGWRKGEQEWRSVGARVEDERAG